MILRYDTTKQRYVDQNGKPVSEKAVRRQIDELTESVKREMRQAARDLATGAITLAAFLLLMRDLLKSSHIIAASVGKGGRTRMSISDWGKVGSDLKKQYGYLNKYVLDIDNKRATVSEHRIASYAESIRPVYYRRRMDAGREAGSGYVRRILHALESCPECVEWADKGFIPIDDMPDIGDLLCNQFCKCELEFSDR